MTKDTQRAIGLTTFEVAKLIPNRAGTGAIHHMTLIRRVARGEFPKPDVQFIDGTRIWHHSTLRAAGILPPIDGRAA